MATRPQPEPCRMYGIKNCDTMKKAMAFLDAQGTAYEFVDYKKAGVAAAHLPDWAARAGWQKLLNTRGLMWKKLSDAQRADVDERKALALMAEYPALIKRPVLDTGDALLVGFDDISSAFSSRQAGEKRDNRSDSGAERLHSESSEPDGRKAGGPHGTAYARLK